MYVGKPYTDYTNTTGDIILTMLEFHPVYYYSQETDNLRCIDDGEAFTVIDLTSGR